MAIEEISRLDVRLDETYCAAGVDFVRELCEGFDTSRLAYIKLARSGREGAVVHGVCRFPGKRAKSALTRTMYRVSCFVGGPFPREIPVRRKPIYRREDGTYPLVPEDCYVAGSGMSGSGPAKVWLKLESYTTLRNEAQAVVWIGAHELFHYLRATRQIPGRNTEIEADAFADEQLAVFAGG